MIVNLRLDMVVGSGESVTVIVDRFDFLNQPAVGHLITLTGPKPPCVFEITSINHFVGKRGQSGACHQDISVTAKSRSKAINDGLVRDICAFYDARHSGQPLSITKVITMWGGNAVAADEGPGAVLLLKAILISLNAMNDDAIKIIVNAVAALRFSGDMTIGDLFSTVIVAVGADLNTVNIDTEAIVALMLDMYQKSPGLSKIKLPLALRKAMVQNAEKV